jgi:uncharacterized damage-inducible protein DinB
VIVASLLLLVTTTDVSTSAEEAMARGDAFTGTIRGMKDDPMPTSAAPQLSHLISRGLSLHTERVRQKVHSLVGPLSHEQLWRRPYAYGNSAGHLLLHVTGNLNYYIGARIAGNGYVRDRPTEFADPAQRAKDDVLRGFDQAVDLLLAALAAQGETDWGLPIEAVGAEDVKDRLSMFVRCVAHLDHHTGQMIYICKELAAL